MGLELREVSGNFCGSKTGIFGMKTSGWKEVREICVQHTEMGLELREVFGILLMLLREKFLG